MVNILLLFTVNILIFNLIILEKKRKGKQPLSSLSTTKKQKSNSRNKENIVEIIDLDNDLQVEQQKKFNNLAQEKLNIQKATNDELEREIILLEKRNHILGLL